MFKRRVITFLNYIDEFGRQLEKRIFICMEDKYNMH